MACCCKELKSQNHDSTKASPAEAIRDKYIQIQMFVIAKHKVFVFLRSLIFGHVQTPYLSCLSFFPNGFSAHELRVEISWFRFAGFAVGQPPATPQKLFKAKSEKPSFGKNPLKPSQLDINLFQSNSFESTKLLLASGASREKKKKKKKLCWRHATCPLTMPLNKSIMALGQQQ